jgi:hypothetical protein
MRTSRRASLARVGCGLALAALAACDRGKAAEDGNPYARQVARSVPAVEQAVGLTFKTPPKVEARSKEQVREFVERQFAESRSAKELAFKERTYKRFGLLPDTLNLRGLLTDLLVEQIVGFYDPKTKSLYVVDGAPPEAAGLVLSHELVHALQDQYLNLDSLQNVEGEDDRIGAAQAVIEGQAVVGQLGGGNVAARLPGGWDRVRELIRQEQASMPIFGAAPMVIQETLIFPYLSGAEFMRHYDERGKGAAALYADLPSSTEQILHPDAYFGTRDAPTAIALPVPAAGGRIGYQNTLGEFESRLYLFQHLNDPRVAARGAQGWDGDRYALVETPQGESLVWVTVWDSAIDAGEFADMMERTITTRGGRPVAAGAGARPGGGAPSEGEARRFTLGGRTLSLTTADVQQRPVVMLVDAPAGAPATPIDVRGVRLR